MQEAWKLQLHYNNKQKAEKLKISATLLSFLREQGHRENHCPTPPPKLEGLTGKYRGSQPIGAESSTGASAGIGKSEV